ncbi:MAG: LPXTG cell wall anchor domain-containing protein, partial [Microcella pacifica]
ASSTLFGQSVAQIFGPGASLAANGGATDTVLLIPGSPAVDIVPDEDFLDVTSAEVASVFSAVDAAAGFSPVSDTPDEDQRGEPRDGLRDAGAVELQADELGSELAATGVSNATTVGWLGAAFVALGSLVLLVRGRRSTV